MLLLTCVTLCSCTFARNDYKYTTMRQLHLQSHTAGNRPVDCGWCLRELRQTELSLIADKELVLSNPIL